METKLILNSIGASLKGLLLDSWLVKLLLTALTTAWVNNAVLIVTIVFLVTIDTITKMGAITTEYLRDKRSSKYHPVKPRDIELSDIMYNIVKAINPMYITSLKFKIGLLGKTIVYTTFILLAMLLEKAPPKILFGHNIIELASNGIFVGILVAEFMSIIENLRDMGSPLVDSLQGVFSFIWDRVGFKFIPEILNKLKGDKKNG